MRVLYGVEYQQRSKMLKKKSKKKRKERINLKRTV